MLRDYISRPKELLRTALLWDSLQGVLVFRRLRRFQIGL